MMTMPRRIAALFLALLMVLSIAPAGAMAYTSAALDVDAIIAAAEAEEDYDGEDLLIVPKNQSYILHRWSFDNQLDGATVVGNRITNPAGGNITFAPGRFGQAAVFDGNSGLDLGSHLITSYTYTV